MDVVEAYHRPDAYRVESLMALGNSRFLPTFIQFVVLDKIDLYATDNMVCVD